MNPCCDKNDRFSFIWILTDGEEMSIDVGLTLMKDLILIVDVVGDLRT